MGTQQNGKTVGQVEDGGSPAGDGGQDGVASPLPLLQLHGPVSLTYNTFVTDYVIWTNPRLKPEAQGSRGFFQYLFF